MTATDWLKVLLISLALTGAALLLERRTRARSRGARGRFPCPRELHADGDSEHASAAAADGALGADDGPEAP